MSTTVPKFELEWLAIFDEVYKARHVTRAAEKLGLAQATVSSALGKLRKRFRDPLFTRTSQGMLPTPFAEALIGDVRTALAAVDNTLNRRLTFDHASAVREFRICCTDVSDMVLVPKLLNHLCRKAPGVSVALSEITPATATELAAGVVDLALGFIPSLKAGFYQQALFDQSFVCLAAADHPRIKHGRQLTKAAFSAEGHVSIMSSATGQAIVERTLAQHGITRRIAVRTSTFLGIGAIIAQTELLAIVPRSLGQALAVLGPLRIIEPPIAFPQYSVKQHWHERFHTDPANAWLRNTVLKLFSQTGGQRRELVLGADGTSAQLTQ